MRLITYRTERYTQSFVPRAEDDDARLTCTASVPGLKPYVETIKLSIDCRLITPIVIDIFGRMQFMNSIVRISW